MGIGLSDMQAQIEAAIRRAQEAARAAAEAAARAAAEAAARAAAEQAAAAAHAAKAAQQAPKQIKDTFAKAVPSEKADGLDAVKSAIGGYAKDLAVGGLNKGAIETMQESMKHLADVRVAGASATALSAVQLPGKLSDCIGSVGKLMKEGVGANNSNLTDAVQKSASLGSGIGGVMAGAVKTADAYQTAKLTGDLFQAARGAQSFVGAAFVQKAMDAKGFLTKGAESLEKAASKALGPAAKIAERVAPGVAEKALGTVAAKAGGRFVPGVNIAIAGLDTANAVATCADPKASDLKKACSVVTAAGSIAAATNIPVVSQVGAAVSAGSSVVSAIWGG